MSLFIMLCHETNSMSERQEVCTERQGIWRVARKYLHINIFNLSVLSKHKHDGNMYMAKMSNVVLYVSKSAF